MARLFDTYVMVDWSAASKPSTGADSIWIGVLSPDARRTYHFRSSNPPTRKAAHDELVELLEGLFRRRDRVLLGFDFALGYPQGTREALGLKGDGPAWAAMHAHLSKNLKDKPDNANNRFPLAASMNFKISQGPFPFWGCPKRDELTTLTVKKAREHGEGDLAEYRHAEAAAAARFKAKPQPVWKLAFPGSVGGQALVGIPVASALRARYADRARFWPFETGWKTLAEPDLEGVDLVMAEIYPSLFDTVAADGQTKDEAQVRAAAEGLEARDAAGKLGALFGPQRTEDAAYEAAIVSEEGWILGV